MSLRRDRYYQLASKEEETVNMSNVKLTQLAAASSPG